MTKCPHCSKQFKPYISQKYCTIKCRKEATKLRLKKGIKVVKPDTVFPKYRCSCGEIFQLKFIPIHNLESLKNVKCPKCEHK